MSDTRRISSDYGTVVAGQTPDGPMVFLYEAFTELTLTGAERLAEALRDMVTARRAAQ